MSSNRGMHCTNGVRPARGGQSLCLCRVGRLPCIPGMANRTCRTEGVSAVLSGVEPVLAFLSGFANTLFAESGAVSVVSSQECLCIGDDKLRTCQWLKDHGFAFPAYADAEDSEAISDLVRQHGFPLIAKPRCGKGAHGLSEIHDRRQLELAVGRPGYVIQEYLGTPAEEYTAGCVSDSEGNVRGNSRAEAGIA